MHFFQGLKSCVCYTSTFSNSLAMRILSLSMLLFSCCETVWNRLASFYISTFAHRKIQHKKHHAVKYFETVYLRHIFILRHCSKVSKYCFAMLANCSFDIAQDKHSHNWIPSFPPYAPCWWDCSTHTCPNILSLAIKSTAGSRGWDSSSQSWRASRLHWAMCSCTDCIHYMYCKSQNGLLWPYQVFLSSAL